MDKDELLKKVSRKTGHRELIRHIELDKKEEIDHLAIDGVFFKQNLKNENDFKKNLFLFNTEHEAESFFEQIKIEKNTYYFSELGADPYSSMIPSEYNLVKRLSIILNILKNPDSCNIVSTYASAHLWLPSRQFFESKEFSIEVSDIISPEELSKKLLALGLKRMPTTEEPGTYSNKGEIFDIDIFVRKVTYLNGERMLRTLV